VRESEFGESSSDMKADGPLKVSSAGSNAGEQNLGRASLDLEGIQNLGKMW